MNIVKQHGCFSTRVVFHPTLFCKALQQKTGNFYHLVGSGDIEKAQDHKDWRTSAIASVKLNTIYQIFSRSLRYFVIFNTIPCFDNPLFFDNKNKT